MRWQIAVGIALVVLGSARSALASGIDSSATVVGKPDGSLFDYAITLNNSAASTDSIGSLWFGWVPGADFLSSSPTKLLAPAGWTTNITHEGTNDGYAIQFVANSPSAALAPGSSLSGFGFTSSDTPAQLAGNSPLFPTFPETTSFVYQGAPLVGDSAQFVAPVSLAAQSPPPPEPSTIPEPSGFLIGAFVSAISLAYLRIKQAKPPKLVA
jgi:hypothetical protein